MIKAIKRLPTQSLPRYYLEMSNTGRNKKLASFNCDEELGEFMRHCQEQGTTATTLTSFIQLYLDGKLDNLDDMLGDCLLMNLQQHLPSHLDKYLATGQDKQLYSTVVALSRRLAPWRHVYSQQMPALIRIRRILLKEFWFIQDRARYLGVSINADQRLKIEMFANAQLSERHGQLPQATI